MRVLIVLFCLMSIGCAELRPYDVDMYTCMNRNKTVTVITKDYKTYVVCGGN